MQIPDIKQILAENGWYTSWIGGSIFSLRIYGDVYICDIIKVTGQMRVAYKDNSCEYTCFVYIVKHSKTARHVTLMNLRFYYNISHYLTNIERRAINYSNVVSHLTSSPNFEASTDHIWLHSNVKYKNSKWT